MIIIRKKSIYVRAYRDGVKISKAYYFKKDDIDSYNEAYKLAKLYNDYLEIQSNNSNTGYRYITLMRRKDNMILLKGTIVRDGEKTIISKTIRSLKDYEKYLPVVMEKIYSKLDVRLDNEINYDKGLQTLKDYGLYNALNLYMVSYFNGDEENIVIIVAASSKREVYNILGIVKGNVSKIGIAEKDISQGIINIPIIKKSDDDYKIGTEEKGVMVTTLKDIEMPVSSNTERAEIIFDKTI